MSDQKKIPYHVAIIPDGNRRWAKANFLPIVEGHRKGFERAKELSRTARKMGIKILTIWAFSTENWNRNKEEIGNLMQIYEAWIDEYLQEAIGDEVKIVHIGRKDRIPKSLLSKINIAELKTKEFTENTLIFALDYGGRDEVLRAIQKMQLAKVDFSNITNEVFSTYLDTASIKDPDLIIRTSGEERTSGFLLWQSEYAEYIFVNKYFPDFSSKDLEDCVNIYKERKRRFGA
jgi:undecaprenyl diphosphate synthase